MDKKVTFPCQNCQRVFRKNIALKKHQVVCTVQNNNNEGEGEEEGESAQQDGICISSVGSVTDFDMEELEEESTVIDPALQNKDLFSVLKEHVNQSCVFPHCEDEVMTIGHFFSKHLSKLLEVEYPTTPSICSHCGRDWGRTNGARRMFLNHMQTAHWTTDPPVWMKKYKVKDIINSEDRYVVYFAGNTFVVS